MFFTSLAIFKKDSRQIINSLNIQLNLAVSEFNNEKSLDIIATIKDYKLYC